MSNTITVEKGLAAHFKQLAGPSRPGVDWMVRIAGDQSGVVIVRTYFSSSPPQESEKPALANKAASLVRQKLEQGWTPQPGASLEVEAAVMASDATQKKPWWKIF
jgi:hypothetical protein